MPEPLIDLVDVSHAQDPNAIDWQKVAAQGVKGAYVRTGYSIKTDGKSAGHIAKLKAAGLDFGTYHYVQPVAGQEKQQAKIMVEEWGTAGATLAPSADLEATPGESPLVAAKDWKGVATWLDAFFDEVDALMPAGTRAFIYTGSWFNQLPPDRAWPYRDRGLWLASYTRPGPKIPWPWDEHLLWQHSGNTIWSDGSWGLKPKTPGAVIVAKGGKVDGFAGEIDCNEHGAAAAGNLKSGCQPRSPLDLSSALGRQRALRRLGHNPGSLDGIWGNGSKGALMHAQQALGLPATGVWDAATEQAVSIQLGA